MTTQVAKVKGHESLVRDMSSHAIVNMDDDAYEAYRRGRDNLKRQSEIIRTQAKEINDLKNDMEQIKEMLSTLIKGK
jgi:hypothetical protein